MRIVKELVLLAVFTNISAYAQTPAFVSPLNAEQTQAIDSFVTTQMVQNSIPGVAVGVYSRGRILLAKGYGLANVELNVPVKPETLFESGSVGKQFTATAIMMLAQEGKLSIHDSVTKYFPDAPQSWKPILIENLLSQTSGIPDYDTPALSGPAGPFYLRSDFTENQLLTKIEELPAQWVPGERWDYSNTNYVLLGILIHRVTGMPYEKFLRERIFKPLDMSCTRSMSQSDIIPNRAAGYRMDSNKSLKNQDWVSPTFDSTADGSLYLNVLDMAKWDAALYNTRLLTQSSLDRMWTPYSLNNGKPNAAHYGFGWWIRDQGNHRVIEHDGAWQGFTSNISRYPAESLTVVVLANLDAAHAAPSVMAHVIAGLVLPTLTASKLVGIPDNRPDIAAVLTNTLSQISADEDVRPLLSPAFAETITPDIAKQARSSLNKFWPGGSLVLVKRLSSSGSDAPITSAFRLSKADNAMMIVITVDSGGKISALRFIPNREYE